VGIAHFNVAAGIAVDSNGRRFAFSQLAFEVNAWLLENF
jgi:hypothetical protein